MKKEIVATLVFCLIVLTSCDFTSSYKLRGTNFLLMEMNSYGLMGLYYKINGGGAGVIDNPVKDVFWNDDYIVVYAIDLETKGNIYYLVHQLSTDTVDSSGIPWTSYNRVPWEVECYKDSVLLGLRLQECAIAIKDCRHYRCK